MSGQCNQFPDCDCANVGFEVVCKNEVTSELGVKVVKDNLMIGITRVIESPCHDDIGEVDMTVKHAEIERFVSVHGRDKAEEKIRKQFDSALDAAFQRIEGCAHAEIGLCEQCRSEVGKF